jgi:O-antigen ligase
MQNWTETSESGTLTGHGTEDSLVMGGDVPPPARNAPELRWSAGFLAMLLYLFVEYMRLSAQYRILLPFQVGKVVVILGLLGWLIAPRVPGKRPAIRLIDAAILGLTLAAFISACFATYQQPAWSTFFDIVRWVAIYFLIGRIVASSWRLRIFVFLLLLLNLKMAQFTIRSFHALQEVGVNAESLAGRGVGAGSVGFFGNAGDFGVAMCVVWPLAGILLLSEKKLIPRLILLASFIGFSGAIVVCGSRGAVVGAVFAALVAWARNPRRIGSALLFLLFIPAVYYVMPEASKARFESALHPTEDRTANSRLEFWRAGLRMFADHPLLGVGPGNFPPEYAAKYSRPGDFQGEWVPHSIYMQALSELGIAGVFPVLLLFLGCFLLNARTRKYLLEHGGGKPKDFEYYMALGLDMALVGFMVSGAFLTVLYYPHLWVILGMSVGLHTAVTSKPDVAKELEIETPAEDFALAASPQGRP